MAIGVRQVEDASTGANIKFRNFCIFRNFRIFRTCGILAVFAENCTSKNYCRNVCYNRCKCLRQLPFRDLQRQPAQVH